MKMRSSLTIRVVHPPTQEDPFLVVEKPSSLPSSPLFEGQDSALTQAVRLFPQLDAVRGKKAVERGLLHRLDTAARGLLLIAATQHSYDVLSAAQSRGEFCKSYSAHCSFLPKEKRAVMQGFPPPPVDITREAVTSCGVNITLCSRFRHWGANGRWSRPVTERSGSAALKKCSPVLYETLISLRSASGEILADCSIARGFKHQVRCHLAWLGFPVAGDELYNPLDGAGGQLAFCATTVSFPHPITGQPVVITL